MKIAAFVYDFPHEKSSQGLMRLNMAGYDVKCIAAPYQDLTIKPSKKRIAVKSTPLHPKEVAESYNYEYIICPHAAARDHLLGLQQAVILGARILPKYICDTLPIINAHPGLLPINRNLDNIKHAILNDFPQGVTTHYIDEQVDRGRLIQRRLLEVAKDDTLFDIHSKIMCLQYEMIIDALKFKGPTVELGKGNYFEPLTHTQELAMVMKYPAYVENYSRIVADYLAGSSND